MKKVVVVIASVTVFQCMYGSSPNWTFMARIVGQEEVTEGFLRELATSEAKYRGFEQKEYAGSDCREESKQRRACFVEDFTKVILPGLFKGENPLKLIVVEKSRTDKKYTEVGYAIFQNNPRYIVQVRYLSVMLDGVFSYLVHTLNQQYPSSLITVTAPKDDLSVLDKKAPLKKLSLTETSRLQLPLFRPCGAHYTHGKGWEYHSLPPKNERNDIYRFVASDDLLQKQKDLQEQYEDAIRVLRNARNARLKEFATAACAALRTLPLADGSSSGDTSPFASASSSRASSPEPDGSEEDDLEGGTTDIWGQHSDGTTSVGMPGQRGYRRLQGRVPARQHQPKSGWLDNCTIN